MHRLRLYRSVLSMRTAVLPPRNATSQRQSIMSTFTAASFSSSCSSDQEPLPRYGSFCVETDGLHYSWRGWGPGLWSTSIDVFDCYTEQWSQKEVLGPSPPALTGGGCAFVGDNLYVFGGYDGSSFFQDLHYLNTSTNTWTEVEQQNVSDGPMCKTGCGLVAVDEKMLACFGGMGIIMQPGKSDQFGWTNEFHLFDTKKNIWSSPDLQGTKLPASAVFSFTKVDQHRAVLFGGRQPGRGRVADAYIFDFKSMGVQRVVPIEGEPWPAGRCFHAACGLGYDDSHPHLLVSGGVDNRCNVLGDLWIFDVGRGKWTELKCQGSLKPRFWHSTTVTTLGPGLAEVVVFAGCLEWPENWDSEDEFKPIADTTILRFEMTAPSLSVAGPSTVKWALTDVAHNITRGSIQRLREKMIKMRQASHRPPVKELTENSPTDSAQDLLKDLQ